MVMDSSQVGMNNGKPFGPYALPKNHSQRKAKLAIIGDEVMWYVAVLSPDKHHGVYRGNPSIKKLSRRKESIGEYRSGSP